MLFTTLGRSVLGKKCALCLEHRTQPTALWVTQDLAVFPTIDLSAGE